jgi:two-component system phosphate regulon sensor histidine kinase PhoR
MRTRIVRRFLWSAFLLLAVSLLALDVYVTRFVERMQIEGLRWQLNGEARMLAAGPAVPGNQLGQWVRTAATQLEATVTVVDGNGVALADSEQVAGPAAEEFLYVAVPWRNPGSPAAALRLGKSLEPVRAEVAALRYRLVGVTLVSLALAALLATVFMRAFSRRAKLLTKYTEQLLNPQIPDQELPGGDDELGLLAQSLRRTAPRIRELVDSLKLEGARREAMLASMVEGVLAVDKDLRVTFCNDSFARTVGARIPVNPGMPLLELVRDPGLLDIMTIVLATGERLERRLTLPGAEAHSFEVLAGPLAGPSTRGALAILHDVTELERLERVRKDFVANVSHELRTPLAAIRGYAETLLDGALEDQQNNRRFVEVIQAQAMRLSNIAADLLTLSELESSEVATQPQSVSVRAALESALRTVEPSARIRSVQLVLGENDDLRVMGQQLRLEQVLVNLLDNAVKFNRPNGEVRVEIRSSDGKACISIADTGTGIPSGDLRRVFERFYRVDKARSRDVGGTGLGLAIVKHVVEQMGGTVTVESRLGEGSRFTLLVPML